jgi:hypothetical protein
MLSKAPGIAYADDLSLGSFGDIRATLMTDGILRYMVEGKKIRIDSEKEVLEGAKEGLRSRGFDPTRPYLDPAFGGTSTNQRSKVRSFIRNIATRGWSKIARGFAKLRG